MCSPWPPSPVCEENCHALLRQWVFDCFRLDPDHVCLWRDAEAIILPPKAFAVLHYLMPHPDRLVTKNELLDTVWPETAVTDAVVRVAIGALRKVLDDNAAAITAATPTPHPLLAELELPAAPLS